MIGLVAGLVAGVVDAKEQRLVFSGYSGSTTLTDFQAMVKLTEGQYGFSYNDYAAKDGSDIWFTDWQGNVIPHEIDLWNASGASYIWVRVPELAGKSTSITMHWGEARTAAQTSSANVWKNNKDGRGGYVGVWHMGVRAASDPEPDATGNGLDAVPYSETSSIGDMVGSLNTGFATGTARVNTQTKGHHNGLKVPDYSKKITDDSRFTMSGWFRRSGTDPRYQGEANGSYTRLFSSCGLDGAKASNGWEVRMNGGDTRIGVSAYDGTQTTIAIGRDLYDMPTTCLYNNIYVTAVFNGKAVLVYENGLLVAIDDLAMSNQPTVTQSAKARQSYLTAEQLADTRNDFGFLIGHMMYSGNSWFGVYDEVRMYDGVETADRVKANYDTMNSPNTFLAIPANVTGTAKVQQLKFAGYTGNETLADFQVLVKLFEGQYGFSYDDYPVKDGSDIWFADSDGNVIPHEIDTWNPSGDSFIWVRVPEVKGPSTYILMHWGAERTSAAEIAASRANVWKNNGDGKGGYVGVWHMGKATGAENEPDASGNGLDATPYTETGSIQQMLATSDSSLGFPTATRCNASAAKNNGLKIPDYSQKISDESCFTVSGWFRASSTENGHYKRFFSARGVAGNVNDLIGWEARQNGDGRTGNDNIYKTLAVSSCDGSTTAAASIDKGTHDLGVTYFNNAVYITVTFDGTTAYLYENGTLYGTDTILAAKTRQTLMTAEQKAVAENDFGFMLGYCIGYGSGNLRGWIGHYDEVRMYDGAESAARIKANYDTMATPNDFLVTDTAIAMAEWTGGGNDGNVANAANWLCKLRTGQIVENALPTVETDVTISGNDLNVNLSVGTALSYRTVTFGNATLAQDGDWRGLDVSKTSFAQGAVIDLKGHNLTLAGFGGAGMITNSVDATTSVLTLDSGLAVNNSGTAVGGNVKFVKEGTGTFTSSRASTYTGGTEVDAGTIQAPLSTAAYDATFTPFGTGRITVNSNAVFNAQSTVAYRNNVILNGGTVMGGAGSGGSRPIVMLEKVTADSAVNLARPTIDIGVEGVKTDLNGHTVRVVFAAGEAYFRWYGSLDGVEGKIVLSGDGAGYFNDMTPIAWPRTVDLEVGSGASLNFAYPVYFRDFTANNGNSTYGAGAANGIYVSGTYTPVGIFHYGCVLQNGATLDISARELPFSLSSSLRDMPNASADTSMKRRTVRFDADATVTVKINQGAIPDPLDKSGFRVVSWDETNKPGNDVRFVTDGELGSKYKLSPKDDGLWLLRHRGLVIYVR